MLNQVLRLMGQGKGLARGGNGGLGQLRGLTGITRQFSGLTLQASGLLSNSSKSNFSISIDSDLSISFIERKSFHTSVPDFSRAKTQQSYSSLLKHKRPDGLNGNERRRKLVKDAKEERYKAKPVSKNTRGFIPTRFKLEPIASDSNVRMRKSNHNNSLTYETLSARKKYKEREEKRTDNKKVKELGDPEVAKVSKFDMADMVTIDSLERKVDEARFENMGLSDTMLEAVKQLFPYMPEEELRPTEIQALAIPELLSDRKPHVLCAAETGSGKTLAYLIPMISRLKSEEAEDDYLPDTQAFKPVVRKNKDFGDDSQDPFLNGTIQPLEGQGETKIIEQKEFPSTPVLNSRELRLLTTCPTRKLNRPRGVVLVPSCALAEQVYTVAKKISYHEKFRCMLLTRVSVRKDILKRLTNPVDVLVTTPASLQRYIRDGTLSLSRLTYLAIDEADTMFEKGFGDDVKAIIQSLQNVSKSQKRKYQLSAISATLPKLVLQTLNAMFPDLVRITTPSLHKALPNCKQHFINLKDYQHNRSLALLDVLRQFEQRSSASVNQKARDRVIIFCNTRNAVASVTKFLTERKISSLSLYGGDSLPDAPKPSTLEIQSFLYPAISTATPLTSSYEFANPRHSSPLSISEDQLDEVELRENIKGINQAPKILVCTDLASRGLDTTAVNHVILYEFPTSVVDFLHRSGRTARAGKTGIVTSLIGKKDRLLSERIRRSVRTNTVLG